MSFNLYLAGGYASAVETELLKLGANRLYSQLNDRKLGQRWLDYNRDVAPRKIFVDSGAYSAHTKGRELDVDEYIQYVNSNKGSYQAIAQVDTIPGEFGKPKTRQQLKEAPELSWQNYLYMRPKVIDVDCLLPIFHQGEDFKHLQRILDWTDEEGRHIPYIGISPSNDVATKHKDPWFSMCFKLIKQSSNPHVKTHAFGMTSLPLLEKYPFYSADSTAWIMTSANGSIFTPWGTVTVSDVQQDSPKHIRWLSKNKIQVIEQQLDKYNLTLDDCRQDYKARGIYNAMYLMDWAKNYKFKGNNVYQKRLF